MLEGLKKVKFELKEIKKSSRKSKKRNYDYWSDSTNDSWSIVLGITGELVHVADVTNKIKKVKIDSYPTNPITTTTLDNNNSSFLEQKKTPPSMFYVKLQLWQL